MEQSVQPPDIPTPIDFRLMTDATEWERTALEKRPNRPQIFDAFAAELLALGKPNLSVLELGSGPGFLAEHLLARIPSMQMTLLDFSDAMHSLAKARLGSRAEQVTFLTRSFKEPEWTEGLAHFDAVVTNQAVHELRHTRHAEALHRQVRRVLKKGGVYLVCDHFFGEGGLSNDQLYMTIEEQQRALERAGYDVKPILKSGSLMLYRAT